MSHSPAPSSSTARSHARPSKQASAAYDRHKAWLVKQVGLYGTERLPPPPRTKTELDVIREHHRFIRDEAEKPAATWEDALALRFYNKLFREYALVDLKHYKSGTVAMRWRTEDEVLDRRGELTCGGVRCEHHRPAFEADVDADEGEERPLVPVRLAAFQLDFAYEEDGQPQRALVKAILCDKCQGKLTYKRRRDARGETDAVGTGGADRHGRSRRRSRSPGRLR